MLDGKAQPLGDGVDLKANTTLAFDVQIAEAGNYRIGVMYQPLDALYTDLLFDYSCGEVSGVASLPVLWADANTVYATDRLGNELIPDQKAVASPLWRLFTRLSGHRQRCVDALACRGCAAFYPFSAGTGGADRSDLCCAGAGRRQLSGLFADA